jgi:uncharacterized membrane protein
METTTPPVQSSTPPVETAEDKTVAILSYCTLIGFVVAIILHQQKKTQLGAYHLRQVLGYAVTSFVGWIALMILSLIIGMILRHISGSLAALVVTLLYAAFGIAVLVLWVLGFIAAIKGEKKPMPVVGPLFQQYLGNVFN